MHKVKCWWLSRKRQCYRCPAPCAWGHQYGKADRHGAVLARPAGSVAVRARAGQKVRAGQIVEVGPA